MFSTAYEHKFTIASLLTWWVIFSLAFSFSLNNHLISFYKTQLDSDSRIPKQELLQCGNARVEKVKGEEVLFSSSNTDGK